MIGRSWRAIRSEPSQARVMPAKMMPAHAYLVDEYARGWRPWSRMYFETVKLSAQRLTVASSIKSAVGRRTNAARYRLISLD
jgi:hypothetical protein